MSVLCTVCCVGCLLWTSGQLVHQYSRRILFWSSHSVSVKVRLLKQTTDDRQKKPLAISQCIPHTITIIWLWHTRSTLNDKVSGMGCRDECNTKTMKEEWEIVRLYNMSTIWIKVTTTKDRQTALYNMWLKYQCDSGGHAICCLQWTCDVLWPMADVVQLRISATLTQSQLSWHCNVRKTVNTDLTLVLHLPMLKPWTSLGNIFIHFYQLSGSAYVAFWTVLVKNSPTANLYI